jgi:hypothetical protein
MPSLPLAEITLPAPEALPPMVFFGASYKETPPPPLPSRLLPLTSVPM